MNIVDKLNGGEQKIFTKKMLRIYTTDSKIIERNLSGAPNITPGYTVPANEEATIQRVCLAICQGGFTDSENTNESCYSHIGPASILKVSVSYE